MAARLLLCLLAASAGAEDSGSSVSENARRALRARRTAPGIFAKAGPTGVEAAVRHGQAVLIKNYGDIDGNRTYLSATSAGLNVDLWSAPPAFGGREWWTMTRGPGDADWYHIEVLGGVTSNRKFLSCSKDGRIVDLWHEDEGNGRQRWKVTRGAEVAGVDFADASEWHWITVASEVPFSQGGMHPEAPRILTATPDGSNVFLGHFMAGRQGWAFIDAA